MLHYKRLSHLALNLILLNLNQVINQIDMIDSILPKYNQIIVLNQKQLVLLMHNNLNIKEHHREYRQVDDIFVHMVHQYTFWQSQ